RDARDRHRAAGAAREREERVAAPAGGLERDVLAALEELTTLRAHGERTGSDEHLDAAVRAVLEQVRHFHMSGRRTALAAFQPCEEAPPRVVIHRPPVVGIDERQIPQLRSLV